MTTTQTTLAGFDSALSPTTTAPCPTCQAPPPRRGSFGIIACEHQIAAGLVPA